MKKVTDRKVCSVCHKKREVDFLHKVIFYATGFYVCKYKDIYKMEKSDCYDKSKKRIVEIQEEMDIF